MVKYMVRIWPVSKRLIVAFVLYHFISFLAFKKVVLRKFKKLTHNGNYRKIVAAFFDLLKKNEDFIILKRTAMKEKSLKNLTALLGSFDAQFAPGETTPLEKERDRIQ